MTTALNERRAKALRTRKYWRYGSFAGIVVAALFLIVGLPWLVWRGPYFLDAKYVDTHKIGDGTGSAALITGLRTALVACVAALGAGLALLYTARTYRLNHRGQVTERFTKALERLGADDDKIYVRIGGILALEQIVKDAPEQATDAAQVLGHFIRHRAPTAQPPIAPTRSPDGTSCSSPLTALPNQPAADIQTALTALTRHESRIHVDSRETLDLRQLHLAGAKLNRADLTGAVLSGAILTDAEGSGAILAGARLYGAILTGALLPGADFTDAHLSGADLTGCNLSEANFTGAVLTGANLTSANLDEANLAGANLDGANLTGTKLDEARGLTDDQIDTARISAKTSLPPQISSRGSTHP
ncbi:pentapeptide repeat-containing protein [Streptomyces sp. DSM 41987]|uniref:pentapeptide repeat-containing protein n=1 Tax=Streptomyces TaxID=1883 RepID=UPI0036111FE3